MLDMLFLGVIAAVYVIFNYFVKCCEKVSC